MKKKSEKTLYKAEWLSLVECVYENDRGEEYKWESVKRSKEVLGMVVIAQLVPSRRFILIKQFRPALNGYVLGFPAGLSDGNAEHALVELSEETGYHGKVVDVSPVLKSNSGIVNDQGMTVYVEVDENDSRNQNPHQNLEPSEQIEVIVKERDEIKDFLLKEQKKGTHIGGNLWYLFVLADRIRS